MIINSPSSPLLGPHNDVVDGDVDELDKETNEAHETKANSSCYGYLSEFLSEKSQVKLKTFVQSSLLILTYQVWLVHLLTSLMEFLSNCWRGSTASVI